MAYSNAAGDKLFGLLPAYLREQDELAGGSLKALLSILEASAEHIEDDIRQLHANAFIETAEPWAVPYIGELVGNVRLAAEPHAPGQMSAEVFPDLRGPRLEAAPVLRTRADVAKTIHFRRRKGTLPMLEELARDVSGWPAHAVEFFERLGWSQWVRNRTRPEARMTADLRQPETCGRVGTAFDSMQHSVDVRAPARREGWHNINSIGLFLWRLAAYPVDGATPRRAGSFGYHFSPLGNPAPLFSARRREAVEIGLASELDIPQPIRPARLHQDLRETLAAGPAALSSQFYGSFAALNESGRAPEQSIFLRIGGIDVPAASIRCSDLSVWKQPAGALVLVDPLRGRFTLGPAFGADPPVSAGYHYGFPADLGGGPYRRGAWLVHPQRAAIAATYPVDGSGLSGTHPTVGAALQQWRDDGRPRAIIRIGDNRSYAEALDIDLLPVQRGDFLAIEAADGRRPHLLLSQPLVVSGERRDFVLTLGGLLVEGQVRIETSISRLRLVHTTLVPGLAIAEGALPSSEPSIAVQGGTAADPLNDRLAVDMAFCITGGLALPALARRLTLLDCIVDGTIGPALDDATAGATGPALHAERLTLRRPALLREIEYASACIFEAQVTCSRVQAGCVRFSYVAPESLVPRRYCCQPELAEERELARRAAAGPLTAAQRSSIRAEVRQRLRPEYSAEAYGQPAYLQLALDGPPEIATGAEDGAEFGAYCHLKQPQRERNLRTRLEEYLPFGLDYGLIYVT